MIRDYFNKLESNNSQLVARIRTAQGLPVNAQHGYSFIVSALQIIYDNAISEAELINSITDGPDDEQMDTIIIKDGFVDIYDFKGTNGYGINELRLFANSIENIFLTRTTVINNLNNRNSRLVAQVTAALDAINNHNAKIRIRVARYSPDKPGQPAYNAIRTTPSNAVDEPRVIYSGYDLMFKDLKITQSAVNYVWPVQIKIQNQQQGESQSIILRRSSDNEITSMFCRIKLKDLVDLYHHFQPMPEIIFDANVRGLQNDRKIKGEMISSLRDQNASFFHQLHNGITIVCDRVEKISDANFRFHNPQIVNGCQTITNLAVEFKNDRSSRLLEEASVLCKISRANSSQVEAICQASNSQTGIKPWDLRTNDNVQITIEKYLKLNGINYNRKSKTLGQRDLTFVELGQWLFSCFMNNPADAKNNKRGIYDARGNNSTYSQLFDFGRSLPEVLSIVSDGVYLRSKIKNLPGKTYEKAADLHFLAAFYLLRTKSWNNDRKFREIKTIVDVYVSNQMATYQDLTHYGIFVRTRDTWTNLMPLIQAL